MWAAKIHCASIAGNSFTAIVTLNSLFGIPILLQQYHQKTYQDSGIPNWKANLFGSLAHDLPSCTPGTLFHGLCSYITMDHCLLCFLYRVGTGRKGTLLTNALNACLPSHPRITRRKST